MSSASESGGLRSIAVVLAGGTGTRVGLRLPKQLLKVAGKPLLEHTLDVFESSPDIDEIIVLMAAGWRDEAAAIVQRAGMTKVSRIMEGGGSRNDTSILALDAITDSLPPGAEAKVLIHDAVRPLVDHQIIADCVRALDTYSAVDVAIPSVDTIVVVDDENTITDIPNRSRLRRGQTPQAFRLSTIRRAYELAAKDPVFTSTDGCGVVLHYLPDVPITVVDGSEQNMKVTYPIDVFLADQLFRVGSLLPPRSPEAATGDVLAGKTLVVFGGSYGIGAEIADEARDLGADVYCHSRSLSGVHVEDPAQVQQALDEAYQKTGRIDFIAVTAGVLHTARLDEAPDEMIAESVAVNLLGPIYVARAAHRYLAETAGQLLLFTSSSYTRGRAGYSLYSATKAAAVNLTQALADEWAEDGISVNCLNPERTQTPMRTKAFGEEPPGSLLPARTVGQAAIDVLLGDQTGHVIDVRRDPIPSSYESVGEQPAPSSAASQDDMDQADHPDRVDQSDQAGQAASGATA